jgi:hypothetical protein
MGSFQLTRPRSDSVPPALPEFPVPALAVGGAVALGAGALLFASQRHADRAAREADLVPVRSSTDT